MCREHTYVDRKRKTIYSDSKYDLQNVRKKDTNLLYIGENPRVIHHYHSS